MDAILSLSATHMADQIRAGKLSAIELIDAYIARIEAVNPAINAVVTNRFAQAREEARAADQATDKSRPLHGVPFTLKDSIDTHDLVTTYGTVGRRDFKPNRDATVAARLRAAGAILLGKTNTPEFTLGGETENDIYGCTNNPYDLTRTPGGSSAGAGAIIASNGTPFDLGSDTGGSIREPANFCGIVGIKPTFGRVPRTGHAVSYGIGAVDFLTQIGPMARTAADLELILSLIAGPDGHDPTVAPVPLKRLSQVNVEKLRIAMYTDGGLGPLQPEIKHAVESAAQALINVGATIIEDTPPPLTHAPNLHTWLIAADQGAWLKRLLEQAGTHSPGRHIQRVLDGTAAAQTPPLAEIMFQIGQFQAEMLAFIQPYDAIICPVEPYVAPQHGYVDSDSIEDGRAWGHMNAYNLTGWPCGSVPVGLSSAGLPIGVQVVGRPWREDVVLAIMNHLQSEFGPLPPPQF